MEEWNGRIGVQRVRENVSEGLVSQQGIFGFNQNNQSDIAVLNLFDLTTNYSHLQQHLYLVAFLPVHS